MKIEDMETIYQIFDPDDSAQYDWYGTEENIINYLKEMGLHEDGEKWIDSLANSGFEVKRIN